VASKPAAFAAYCPVSRSGYVRGKTGIVSAGIREFELIINPVRVIADTFQHAGVAHSWHHCGLAVDVRPEVWIWDLIWPWRDRCPFLGGPTPWGGLYSYGHRYYDPHTQAAHQDHICVYFNLTPDEVDRLTKVPRRKHLRPNQPAAAPPGQTVTRRVSPRYKPVAPDKAWRALTHRLGHEWPAIGADARATGNRIVRALRS
jgi:hypothetical protein